MGFYHVIDHVTVIQNINLNDIGMLQVQKIIIKFLVTERVLTAEFNIDLLQCSMMATCDVHVYLNGVLNFQDSQSVSNDVHIGVLHTAVTADSSNRVENCILEDRCLTVCRDCS